VLEDLKDKDVPELLLFELYEQVIKNLIKKKIFYELLIEQEFEISQVFLLGEIFTKLKNENEEKYKMYEELANQKRDFNEKELFKNKKIEECRNELYEKFKNQVFFNDDLVYENNGLVKLISNGIYFEKNYKNISKKNNESSRKNDKKDVKNIENVENNIKKNDKDENNVKKEKEINSNENTEILKKFITKILYSRKFEKDLFPQTVLIPKNHSFIISGKLFFKNER
jgi:hypothetical protein